MKRNKMSDRRNKPTDHRQGAEDCLNNYMFIAIYKKMYLNTKTADVHFICDASNGQTERVPAHKAVLSVSEKFEALFATDSTQNEFTLAGTSSVVFKEFLRFFYFPKIRLTIDNVTEMLKLATSYGNDEITKVCCSFIEQKSVGDNLIRNYALAIQVDRTKMKQNCEQKIIECARDIFKSNDFLGCDRDVLSHILELDGLKCDEFDVLTACLSWAGAAAVRKGLDNTNIQVLREELGDLIYLIRFRSMNIQSFSTIIGTFAGLFSGNEYEEIIQLIVNKDFVSAKFKNALRHAANGSVGLRNAANGAVEKKQVHKPVLKADAKVEPKVDAKVDAKPDTKPEPTVESESELKPSVEHSIGNGAWAIDRFSEVFSSRYYLKKVEKLRFMVNKSVLMTGFTIGQLQTFNRTVPTSIPSKIIFNQLLSNGEASQIYTAEPDLMCDKEVFTEIKEHVHITQNVQYEIRLEQATSQEYFNQFILKTEVKFDDGFEVTFNEERNEHHYVDPKFGLITKLYFKADEKPADGAANEVAKN